jgi:RND family efflux transporter MFP subunit
VTVRDTVLPAEIEVAGVAEPIERATLSTRLVGTVTAVLVREGQRVEAGRVLARIDARDITARRAQAAAGSAAAEAGYRDALTQAQRFRALFADSAATRYQLDQAETSLARAEGALSAARAAQDEVDALQSYSEIRAPFNGSVTRRFVDPGAFVSPGTPIIEVQNGARLRIAVTTTPSQAAGLKPGATADVTIEGSPAAARIEGVVPTPDGALYTINALVDNRNGRFLPGSAATVLLPSGVRRAVLVPGRAVVREGDLTGVDLIRDGEVERRWVRLGRTRGDLVEVLSGLAGGEQVAVPE